MISIQNLRVVRDELSNADDTIKQLFNTFLAQIFSANKWGIYRNTSSGDYTIDRAALGYQNHRLVYLGQKPELEERIKYLSKNTKIRLT